MSHYNIILANALINNGNRGCVALSISTMYIIDRILSEAGISYTFFLPDSQFTIEKEYEIKLFDKVIKYRHLHYCQALDVKDNIKLFFKSILKGKDYTKVFRTADFIFDIGQGDSFSDIYGIKRFNLIDRIHKIARKYNKPYCILPQTIGPFISQNIKNAADESIAKASICMARDKQSYDYVVNNVLSQKFIKEYIDVAFFLPYERIDQNKDNVHVGINISALLWHGGYSQDNQFCLKDNYQSVARSVLEYFLSLDNVKVHLIPHVVSSERCIENDYEVAYDLWKEYKTSNLVIAPFALGPVEIKSYISGLDFFLGARMHATIGAFSAGVPVVPMAYSRKFNGLFESTLDYPYMIDLKKQDVNECLHLVREYFEKRSELKCLVEQRMSDIVKEKEFLLVSDLKSFFSL